MDAFSSFNHFCSISPKICHFIAIRQADLLVELPVIPIQLLRFQRGMPWPSPRKGLEILFLTWIVSDKSDDCPSIYGHTGCVSERWINKVEFRCICSWIEVTETLCKDVEIISVKVNWVVLSCGDISSLWYSGEIS